jgi:hypothetical protein
VVTLLVLVGAFFLVTPILALIALSRSGRVSSLEERIAELERQVRALSGRTPAATTPREEAVTTPRPAPSPPEPPRVLIEPAPPPLRERPPVTPPPPPPPQASVPPPAEPPPPPPWAVDIDWERLFGVRGAAVLGGIALALAGLLFFKYSIDHGLIPPWLRVVLGLIAGLTCIALSEWKLRASYPGTASALAGAGIVILYAASWAAAVLYHLIPLAAGFALMMAVTAACCVLSWRYASLVVACLGLIGGFATPLLLSSGADRPIGLFTYILLLDGALLYLAQRRRWPTLALLSLGGTVLYQALWIFGRMGPHRAGLGLAILGVFTLVFMLAALRSPEKDEQPLPWLVTQAGSVLFPFAFAFYFAADARLGPHLVPLGLLLLLLSTATSWLGRMQQRYWLGRAAAAGSVAVIGTWLLTRSVAGALAWEAVGVCLVIALAFHLFVELEPERPLDDGPAVSGVVASGGLFAVLLGATGGLTLGSPWPWLMGWLGLAAMLVRHGGFAGRELLQPAAAGGLALALAIFHRTHHGAEGFPALSTYLAVMVAVAVGFQGLAVLRGTGIARTYAEHAAALLPILLLGHLATAQLHAPSPSVFLGASLGLGILVTLAATRVGSGYWFVGAVAATALAHTSWSMDWLVVSGPSSAVLVGFGLQLLAVLLFTAWPFLAARSFSKEPWAWYAAAFSAPAWFPSLRRLYEIQFGDGAIAILPLALGAISLGAAIRARDLWPRGESVRTGTIAWFAAVALGFVSVAIPLQLEKEWITIGWALEGLAVTALWTRLDHPGLKYFGLALLAATTIRLVANPAVLGYYPRPDWRIVNWLLYTYLVPAAALFGTARLLHPLEVERARAWEAPLYQGGRPLGALAAALAGLVVVFVWLNLAIADWFSSGPMLTVSFERLPARDLATSIVWALYALAILALGMARQSTGLRWVSLTLLMVTIAKVFLYDLGELRDLYRVASLLGLAISLILVSIAYQRFVFQKTQTEEA